MKKEEQAERIEPDLGWEERVKKALEEPWIDLQKPPKGKLSPKCCPHCWLHEPIGLAI